MGVLIEPYSQSLKKLEEDWKLFKRALKKEDKPAFDQLFQKANYHVPSGQVRANPFPIRTFFMSVCLEQQKENNELNERIKKLESIVGRLEKQLSEMSNNGSNT